MNDIDTSLTNPEPAISEEFFRGNVEQGLRDVRRRLLDLTNRNKLLNFKHTRRSSLRIVDEIPDQLFKQLDDGASMLFKAVPRPRRSRPELPLDLGDLAASQPSAESRARVPSAAEHAATLGIDTSFDLPASPAHVDPRHSDREIQTLHYAEELEAILRTITSAARLAIEETGTNMLYLAFGFLEWYESEDSEQVRSAPLLLVPASIERGTADSVTQTYRYAIAHSGEDIVANISLQEKMRQDFSLVIPDPQEEELPESYLQRVAEAVEPLSRWRVRRQVTLSLLSFGKLLMYRDLNPNGWPLGKSPADHPRIRDLFLGAERVGGVGYAPDYQIDAPPINQILPAIVDDADSSQHSALVDVFRGNNLVIQGPPGTGKSQTITNLIAAAMAQGKSVLFVSEKLAALEVVRHRLNRAGLGQFCLELHSHKTQKKAFIEDLRSRLEATNSFGNPGTLSDRLAALDRQKRLLTEHVERVNLPFGGQGQSIYDILWQARRLKSELGFDPLLVERLYFPTAHELSFSEVEESRNSVRSYAQHLKAVGGGGNPASHPWAGVSHPDISFLDEHKIAELLSRVEALSSSLATSIAGFSALVGPCIPATVVGVRTFSTALGQVKDQPDLLSSLLPALQNGGVIDRLRAFGHQIEVYRSLREKLINQNGSLPTVTAEDAVRLSSLASSVSGWLAAPEFISDLEFAGERLSEAADTLLTSSQVAAEIKELLGVEHESTVSTLDTLDRVLALLRRAPVDRLDLRHPALLATGAAPKLATAISEAARLRAKREELSRHLQLDLCPPRHEVQRHAVTAANARWWSLLSPSYRAARGAYRLMCRNPDKLSLKRVREDYQALAVYLRLKEAFDGDDSFKEVAGPAYRGIDSPFEEMLSLVAWWVSIEEEVLSAKAGGEKFGHALWSGRTERLKTLALSTGVADRFTTGNRAGLQAAAGLSELLSPDFAPKGEEKLQELSARTSLLGQRARAASEAFRGGNISGAVRLGAVPELLSLAVQHDQWIKQLSADEEVAAVLGTHFDGPNTDFRRVVATLAFYEHIVASPLPVEARHWVLERDTLERLSHLKEFAARAVSDSAEMEKSFGEFASFVRLTVDWFNPELDVSGVPFDRVRERASRALVAREKLPEWLDYLRARRKLLEEKLEDLVRPAEEGLLQPEQLLAAFNFVFANSLARTLFQVHPQLIQFSGLSHDQARKRFVELDLETIQLTRSKYAHQIDQRVVPLGNGNGPVRTHTELSLIERETSKQKRHIPIRQLVLRSGRALQALKPCFMMGPLSVAQYLAAGKLEFDLIVMDEASQLRPEDALGAVCRGSQLVVVGDPMQLPPTSFFDRIGEEELGDDEEDGKGLTEAESILDVASAVYRPMRMLKWHYRSKHGSLIAYSNKQFYGGKLVVFPSPVEKSAEFGVKLVYVNDGLYENRKNVIEARRVVDAALNQMQQRPTESLGIVALNSVQREVIENELEQRLKSSPLAQQFVQKHEEGLEPLFIKNLENVQGDERDVIFISVTYGPNERGQVYQRFGPINGDTGHRRLNVLFTRARKRVVVFSSMLAEHVHADPSSKPGVVALKGYLSFAQTGVLEQATFTGRAPDSDFEIEVAEALRARGFEVVAQLGVAGYFLDLAVKHPRKPDAFLAAIECDGATYHSALSARDRDRLRQSVLESLGWNVLRVWSTDWFKNRSAQVDRIITRLGQLLHADSSVPESAPEPIVGGEFTSEPTTEPTRRPDRISVEEARNRLIQLRELKITTEQRRTPSTCILREEMIEALLRHRPVDRQEWIDRIPFELRVDTDGKQMAYLDEILDLISQIST